MAASRTLHVCDVQFAPAELGLALFAACVTHTPDGLASPHQAVACGNGTIRIYQASDEVARAEQGSWQLLEQFQVRSRILSA
eukprot:scaffold280_cov353-Prasinococcus_capsulatus_cf.AAC.5